MPGSARKSQKWSNMVQNGRKHAIYMLEKMIKNYTTKDTLRKALKGTNRGVHNHHFHAGFASK